jgi:hypothetical protein
MPKVIRVALPEYNAETDTNPDHFSLYSDEDNILIKRAFTGLDTIAAVTGAPGYVTDTIPHSLNYIPFYVAFADQYGDGDWTMLNNQYNPVSVPNIISGINTTNLFITNFNGLNADYTYDIFYDDMSQSGTPSITESEKVFKVAKSGVNALTSKNPNDYIMHSDLNNLKILKQGTADITLTPDAFGFGTISFAHEAIITTPYKYFLFIKFPDGKTTFIGGATGGQTYSYDGNYFIFNNRIDDTNIKFNFYIGGSAINISVSHIIYGTATNGSLLKGSKVIAVAKSGCNALTETNPENFNFHSLYPTLKYYTSNAWDMGTISDNTVKTIAHNQGHVPFFIGFVNDLANIIYSSSEYCIAPNYWGRSTIPAPSQDIAAFIYADDTNIYLKAYYQVNAVGTNKAFNWYYKIFKNNLNL